MFWSIFHSTSISFNDGIVDSHSSIDLIRYRRHVPHPCNAFIQQISPIERKPCYTCPTSCCSSSMFLTCLFYLLLYALPSTSMFPRNTGFIGEPYEPLRRTIGQMKVFTISWCKKITPEHCEVNKRDPYWRATLMSTQNGWH